MAFPVGTWKVKAEGVPETLTIESMYDQNGFLFGTITEASGQGAPIAGIYNGDTNSIEFVWPIYSNFTNIYVFKGTFQGTSFEGHFWVSHIPAEQEDVGRGPGSWTASQA